jgi:uncharacterized protein YndB with AHSA1/START domain
MAEAATKSIVVERVIPHAPEKIWRALTQAPMIAEWLMKNDFKAVRRPQIPVPRHAQTGLEGLHQLRSA